ncbi:unnamed protein product, partial [Tenebrio molitor]
PGCHLGLCHKDNLHSIPCPTVETDDPKCFKVLGDESKPWPSCCPIIECN